MSRKTFRDHGHDMRGGQGHCDKAYDHKRSEKPHSVLSEKNENREGNRGDNERQLC